MAASEIENTDLRGQYDRLRRSVTLFRDLVGLTDSQAVFSALLNGISREFPTTAAFIGRVRSIRRVVEVVAGQTIDGYSLPTNFRVEHPAIAKLLRSTRGTLLVTEREQMGDRGMITSVGQSLMAVRFRLEGDEPDLLLLESDEPSAFTADDIHFVHDLLQTLEATLLSRYARSRADREMDLLIEVTRGELDMASDLDEAELSRLLQKVLEIALSLTGCRHGAVLLADEESGSLQVEAETFSADIEGEIPRVIKKQDGDQPSGIVFRVLEDNRAYLANDASKDLHYIPVFEETRASLAVPITFQERCIGVILVEAQETGRFTPEHERRLERLAATATSFVRRAQLYQETRSRRGSGVLIKGRGPAWQEVERRIERAAGTSATVCLRGESGTGKELVANAIHFNSDRSKRPFVVVNCAAIPSELLESELFGHVKGAFTGAVGERAGRFEAADGGTLFLDEIGDLPPGLQVKLLRVLQSGEIRKVGSDKPRHVDVRVIAATSRNLEEMMGRGTFREDLYYRLMVVPMYLPPLRSYRDSIPGMVKQFLRDANVAYGRSVAGLDERAMFALSTHNFPGNVRELRNIVEQSTLMAEESVIQVNDLPGYLRGERPPPPMPGSLAGSEAGAPAPGLSSGNEEGVGLDPDALIGDLDPANWDYKELKERVVRRFEERYHEVFLGVTGGNVTRAAELAGVHRVNLHRMIKRRDGGEDSDEPGGKQ
ncbi:MAG: sigma 54-interacting transcriptional regulator [Myxococcota bacterium]|nr:sigma 54-interacting transcriptional regulator [Myxococcota bacterium]